MAYTVCYAPLNCEILPEIHAMEKCDVSKPVIHSQII